MHILFIKTKALIHPYDDAAFQQDTIGREQMNAITSAVQFQCCSLIIFVEICLNKPPQWTLSSCRICRPCDARALANRTSIFINKQPFLQRMNAVEFLISFLIRKQYGFLEIRYRFGAEVQVRKFEPRLRVGTNDAHDDEHVVACINGVCLCLPHIFFIPSLYNS